MLVIFSLFFTAANAKNQVGVFSFHRFLTKTPPPNGYPNGTLWRSVRLMTHELCHQFNIKHCVEYRCLMNGCNHLDEADSRPIDLCPSCLRKLHHSCGFDPIMRYRALLDYCRKHDFHNEVEWFTKRLQSLENR